MKRALVVDDSRAMRLILSRILAAVGLDAVQASNGREAWDLVQREGAALDLLLVDWNMPEMNGLDVVRLVRSRSDFQHIRIIMVTTETEVEQITLALEAGADEYIMKPFTQDVIEDKLRMAGVECGPPLSK
jgi:two-component system chemotaxis response regulator CheY